jgi:hypothetical protein
MRHPISSSCNYIFYFFLFSFVISSSLSLVYEVSYGPAKAVNRKQMRRRNARRREEGEEGEEAESEQTTADGTLGAIAEPTQDTARYCCELTQNNLRSRVCILVDSHSPFPFSGALLR